MCKNITAIAVLAGAMFFSIYRAVTVQKELFDPSKKIIRIVHWQLETGYRKAMDHLIKEYEKLHPDTRIIQIGISEKFFSQWLITHLTSRTAPDLVKMGQSKIFWQGSEQYIARYFKPLTAEIALPNPYNKGTAFEGVPWRETVFDGGKGGFKEFNQEYYGLSLTTHSVRIYYNRDLFLKITGSDRPVKSFGELMAVCRQIKEYAAKNNRDLIPIAGSMYTYWMFDRRYRMAFTSRFERELDIDLDGEISKMETFLGISRGSVSFVDPTVRAYYEYMKDICDQFQPGFMSVGREQSVFMFVQDNAAMIATGSWDATSLSSQAKFSIGVFDFPLPAKGEKYFEHVHGRPSDGEMRGGSVFAVYRFSRHPEVCIDFLRFITSQKNSEKFAQHVGWISAAIGAEPLPELRPFVPDPKGYSTFLQFAWSGYSWQVMNGMEWQFFQGEIAYDDLARKCMAAILDPELGNKRGWVLNYERMRKQSRESDRMHALLCASRLCGGGTGNLAGKSKVALLRQITRHHNNEFSKYLYGKTFKRKMPEK